jgi:arylsulfatase A-like enzyme
MHVGLPHEPYMFNSQRQLRVGKMERPFQLKNITQQQLSDVRHLYLEIAYTDRLFGSLMTQLKERNLYEPSLIIVTSDHGVSFDRAHPGRSQEWIDVDEIGRVPFLVKMPGQHTGWIDDRRILNVDMYQIVRNVLKGDRPQTDRTS